MPRLPRITAEELLKALGRDEWYRDHQTGGHVFLRHSHKLGKVNVPIHSGRTLKLKTLESILDTAELSIDESLELM